MKNKQSWQVETESARFYEQHFVPALFAQWAPRTVRAAEVRRGDRVLDVATGTGLVARFAENQTAPTGSVVGYDLNPGMLAVAASIAPQIEWMPGPAEKLPFNPETFDAVTCQFALAFFQDPASALREMYRVLKPGRTMAVVVWDALDKTPGYAAFVHLLDEICGEKTAAVLRAPFELGGKNKLKSIFKEANIPEPVVQTQAGTVNFPSIAAWIECDVMASTIKNLITKEQLDTFSKKAVKTLQPFMTPEGQVRFSISAHIATITR